MALRTTECGRHVKGYYQRTDITVAIGVPGPGEAVAIQAELGDLRVRFDGVAPTSTVGHLIVDGAICYFTGDLSGVRIIEVDNTAVANIHVYGPPLD